MSYNEYLATRVRLAFKQNSNVEEKKMMGGLTFMVNGKMCVGILKDDLMVRLDPEVYETALQKTGCREMNFTGRPMKGFVFVGPEGTEEKADLDYWIELAIAYNKKVKVSIKKNNTL